MKQGNILDEFDRIVFESIVDKVIVGDTNEDGSIDPYKLTFVLKGNGNHTIDDVVEELRSIYRINIRLKGNTISYALPYRPGKGGRLQAVRGSKLGDKFTVAGITDYMEKKEMRRLEYERLDAEIEKANDSIKDYDQWEERKNESSTEEQVTEQIEEVLPDKDTYNECKKESVK